MSGWSDFEEILAEAAEDLATDNQTDLVDKLFVDALNNPAGMKLLRFWKRTYLDQPVCVPGAGAEVGFHREGQNSIIREAMQRLTRGLTPKT